MIGWCRGKVHFSPEDTFLSKLFDLGQLLLVIERSFAFFDINPGKPLCHFPQLLPSGQFFNLFVLDAWFWGFIFVLICFGQFLKWCLSFQHAEIAKKLLSKE